MSQLFDSLSTDTQFPNQVKRAMLLSISLSILCIFVSTVYYFYAQPVLPLFYSFARPVQQLAPKIWLFLLPAISVLVTIFHLLILKLISSLDEIIVSLFAGMTITIQVLLTLVLLRIIIITL